MLVIKMPFLGVFIFIKVRLKFGKIIKVVIKPRCVRNFQKTCSSFYLCQSQDNNGKTILILAFLWHLFSSYLCFECHMFREVSGEYLWRKTIIFCFFLFLFFVFCFFFVLELSRCRFNLCMF